ncbi:F0F1 ATP synthase subunit delta, partial [Francisella tularensis subsp. holarctica]|uniref:F0F1 ATP synthase subunit delta n=1 Tax=Francisella tularensis TaxID=263 RepID=UPI002381C39C
KLVVSWSKLHLTFSELFKDKSVAAIVSSPTISQIEVVDALKKQLDEYFFNFLALIAENKKLLIMPEISDQFESIKYIHN